MSGKQRFPSFFPRRRPRRRAQSGSGQHRLIGQKYQLQSELGHGGMGTVWLGYDTFLGRQVAVKVVRAPSRLTSADLLTQQQRAIREARNAAGIKNANAVTVYDAIEEDGVVYLIMEFVEGGTLRRLIDRDGPLPAAQVAAYGTQLLGALAAAHALGIVHRDVNPRNVMIASDGQVKLTDFGLAQIVGDSRLTSSGVVMGTQAYLAPELFKHAPITPAADLWSLGVTLYEAAVGRNPFDRETPAATLHAIVLDDLPVPPCDPALAAAITTLLRRDPRERATIEQARSLLSRVAGQPQAAGSAATPVTGSPAGRESVPTGGSKPVPSGVPVRGYDPEAVTGQQSSRLSAGIPVPMPPAKPSREPRPPRHRRRAFGATALATVVVVVAAVVLLRDPHIIGNSATPPASPSPSPTKPKPKPTPTLPPPTKPSGLLWDGHSTLGVTAVAFSSDGSLLATGDGSGMTYLWDSATQQQVGVVDDGAYCQQVTTDCPGSSTEGVNSLAMYNGVLATADQNGFIYQWSTASATLGQPQTPLLQDPQTHGGVLAIAYDSTGDMATGDGDGNAYLWNDGSVNQTLPDQNSPMQPVTAVAFSPDGTILAAGDQTGTTNLWSWIGAMPGDSPGQSLSDPQGGQVNSLAFGGTSSQLLAIGDADGHVCVYQWQATDPAANCFFSDPSGVAVTSVAFDASGSFLAIGDSSGDVYLYSLANSAAPKSLLKQPFSNPGTAGDDTYLPNLKGVSSLAFDPGSPTSMLAVGDANGKTYLWPMNWLP
jgi:serine/threonine protein kinase/WD40 repeat protein